MHKVTGWNDKYTDESNDLIIVLADVEGKLITFKNTISKLYIFIEEERESGLADEFPEIVFARNGEAISFEQASKYFPKLTTKEFWESSTFTGYNEMSVEEILKQI